MGLAPRRFRGGGCGVGDGFAGPLRAAGFGGVRFGFGDGIPVGNTLDRAGKPVRPRTVAAPCLVRTLRPLRFVLGISRRTVRPLSVLLAL